MDTSALKNFLSSFFATILKAIGGAFVGHHLVTPETANGLLSYSDMLAGLVLIGAGHIISYLKADGFKKEADAAKKYGELLSNTFDKILSNHFISIPIQPASDPQPPNPETGSKVLKRSDDPKL